ncbi:MAG: hypothetical protein O3A65_08515 [Proteobacteria bacterium]|nr:hypothetical protein [Pseudomonadota bacterium]
MPADPYFYHLLAKKNVESFYQGGLAFSFFPDGQGVAGIASLSYLIIDSVYAIVFLNCILHAASAVILFQILRHWFSPVSSIVGMTPLLLSPYMMYWFSQINKESFTLFGALLFMYGFIKFLPLEQFFSRRAFLTIIQMIIGLLSIWLVRPFVIQLLLPAVTLISGAAFFYYKKNKLIRFSFGVGFITLFSMIGLLGSPGQASHATVAQAIREPTKIYQKDVPIVNKCHESILNWQQAEFLPSFVDKRMRGLMEQRCRIFTILGYESNPTVLKSFFSVDWFPMSSLEAIYYIPTAFFYGVLSPNFWELRSIIEPKFSIFYLFSILESYLMYAGLAGLFLWVLRYRQFSVLVPILCSLSVMTIFAIATPFLGALYRYRYSWWILLIGLGLAALSELRNRRINEGCHTTGSNSSKVKIIKIID